VPFSGVKPKRPEHAEEIPHQEQKREYVRDDDKKREWTRTRFQTRQSQALNAVQDSEQFSSHDSDDEAWERQWDKELWHPRRLTRSSGSVETT
jgi:hypothetical protein